MLRRGASLCASGLVMAAVVALAGCGGAAGDAVQLENGAEFHHGNITARDERLRTCGSYCEKHCTDTACPFNVASFTNVLSHGGGLDERITVVSSSIGAPSAVVRPSRRALRPPAAASPAARSPRSATAACRPTAGCRSATLRQRATSGSRWARTMRTG